MARLAYPPTPRDDVVDEYHGVAVADPYRWLEDVDGEATRAWIAAQNALTQGWLSEVGVRDRIRRRLVQLWDHPRRGVPWRSAARGDRWFQRRNSGLQDQDVLYVLDAPGDEGRVLVDPNVLGDGTLSLTATAVSRDGALLAYATSAAGSDWMTWHVRPVAERTVAEPELVHWSKFSGAAWAPDDSGFFYGRYEAPPPGAEHTDVSRGQQVWFHRAGTQQSDDVLVYARPDQPGWIFDPIVSEDGRWLVVWIEEGTDPRSRIHLADLTRFDPADPAALDIRPLLDAFDAAYTFVGNAGGTLYFRTDRDAPRGRLVALDVERPAELREVIAESATVLERVALVGGRFVAVELADGRHRLQRYGLDGANEGPIALPGTGTIGELAGKPGDALFHFTFTTFTASVAVCSHDLTTGETRYLSEPGLAVDESLLGMETEQVFVESTDGVRVPMFLVRRADLDHPAEGAPVDVPTLLYGYGGFGISITPEFKVPWYVWLELGGQLAVANLRGGGEYGRQWHDAGRGERKQQVFDDFLACADALVDSGWTTSRRLAITGASNGGLLVGACMTQRPELFAACVPEVGVLDMLRFHRFTIGWAWVSDYGSADDPAQFKTLLGYSPLHNLWPRTAYPATLVTTGDHDDRVVPGHSFKFAAALQAAQAGDAPVMIRVTTDAGHGAGKPTRVSIEEGADVLAFLCSVLSMEPV